MLGFEIQKNIDNQPFRKPIRFQKILAPSRLLGIGCLCRNKGLAAVWLQRARDLHAPGV
jgi:hypothetical protein